MQNYMARLQAGLVSSHEDYQKFAISTYFSGFIKMDTRMIRKLTAEGGRPKSFKDL